MFPIGFLLAALGLWFIDSGIKGVNPLQAIGDIIRNPSHLTTHLQTPSSTTGGGLSSYIPGGSHSKGGTPDPRALEALAWAQKQIGKPYVFGAAGPDAFDCSGLTMRAYGHVGFKMPHSTYLQILKGKPVKRKDLIPGDLVFPDPGHVQIYAGNGQIVEAPHTGLNVRQVPMWKLFLTARRIFPALPESIPTVTQPQGNSSPTYTGSGSGSGTAGA